MSNFNKYSSLLEGIANILEKKHSPFKRRNVMGTTGVPNEPGAPPPSTTRKVTQKKQWNCSRASKYVQTCKGRGDMKGRTKTVFIDPDYKKAYNAPYKSWRRKQPADY